MRIKILTAFAVSVLFANVVDAQNQKDTPPSKYIERVGGKTLDEWIKLIHSSDRSIGQTAIQSVLGFGPDRAFKAVPHIVEELKRHRPPSYPIDASIRVNGVIALGTILGAAKDPDPKLLNDAVNTLRKLLGDTQIVVRYRAAEALGKIGPEAKMAVPALLSMLRDRTTWEARKTAATALGLIAGDGKKGPPTEVLKGLLLRMNDRASQVRLACIQSMTFLGAPADPRGKKQMMDRLILHSLKDPDMTVRIWANMAIMSINRKIENERVVPIAKMLKDEEVSVRVQAAQAVGTIGPKAKAAVPFLTEGLSDKEPTVVSWCIWALARMGKDAASAVPTLLTISNNKQYPEILRNVAQQAVNVITGKKTQKKESNTVEQD